MFRCISSLAIKDEEYRVAGDEDLTQDEGQLIDEYREAELPQHTPDPISDDEEEDSLQPHVEIQSQRGLGKRQKSNVSESEAEEAHGLDDDDADDDPPLPCMQGESNTQKCSSDRKRL
ncbi:hypothetical protein SI65_09949 [Aspergillus cristatus]|uniref:Uncharacterized protein n=1 Tax=Aspergillus cristatus TaxID=573508 RepID=A0A1E3B103_ASPCR|nr:hypothetical protein SI65_09949 [Aspergillus cristatus]